MFVYDDMIYHETVILLVADDQGHTLFHPCLQTLDCLAHAALNAAKDCCFMLSNTKGKRKKWFTESLLKCEQQIKRFEFKEKVKSSDLPWVIQNLEQIKQMNKTFKLPQGVGSGM